MTLEEMIDKLEKQGAISHLTLAGPAHNNLFMAAFKDTGSTSYSCHHHKTASGALRKALEVGLKTFRSEFRNAGKATSAEATSAEPKVAKPAPKRRRDEDDIL